jgi:hypothetical protein
VDGQLVGRAPVVQDRECTDKVLAHPCAIGAGPNVGGASTLRCAMTAKEKLRQAIEDLSELEAEETLAFIARRHDKPDPVLELFANAPEDDEPLTSEDEQSIAEAWAQRDDTVSLDELKRELG